MKKDKLNQIVSVGVLIIAGFVAVNIYQRQAAKISQLQQIHNEQELKNQLLLSIAETKSRAQLYKQGFKAKDSREIINIITEIAQGAGVKIISLRPLERSSTDDKDKIYDKVLFKLDIQVEGYHQLGGFISRLENSPTIFIIESIQVDKLLTARAGQVKSLQVALVISELSFID